MPRMSVSMTLDAVRDQTKTVTRRHVDTWKNLKAGDWLTLIEKGMGLPKGAKQVVVCEVEIVSVRVEPIGAITWDEVVAEGLIERATAESIPSGGTPSLWFVRFWLDAHGYQRLRAADECLAVPCRRIEWRYLEEAPRG